MEGWKGGESRDTEMARRDTLQGTLIVSFAVNSIAHFALSFVVEGSTFSIGCPKVPIYVIRGCTLGISTSDPDQDPRQ